MVTAGHLHNIQHDFAYRFDWGLEGLGALAPHVDVVIIVDILRFTTAVCTALESECTVLPFPWADDELQAYAAANNAASAGHREQGGYSLSPTDLLTSQSGSRIVLPSPNGSTLSFAARDLGAHRVLAGSLRNATATARHALAIARGGSNYQPSIAVIAAGERWGGPTGSMRPAIEDLIGAGAVLNALDPSGAVAQPCCSPEAAAARAAFHQARPKLFSALCASSSGRELLARGWEDDIATSAALDVTEVVAELVGNEYQRA
ncbi:MAG: 2-phosphosulfolactate phosphatase [Actinomycetota bacterium]|jgi:2-phosphosulfolactate phosphatase